MIRINFIVCLIVLLTSPITCALELNIKNAQGGGDELATFKKVDEGETIRFDVVKDIVVASSTPINAIHLPVGSSFDGTSFQWTPSDNQSGFYEISFFTFDSVISDQVYKTIKIFVSDTIFIIKVGQPFLRLFTSFDPDGDKVEITVNGLPKGAVFQGSKYNPKLFRWVPTMRQVGRHAMTIIATDFPQNGMMSKQDRSIIIIRVVKGSGGRGGKGSGGRLIRENKKLKLKSLKR